MNHKLTVSFTGGVIGASVLVALSYLMMLANMIPAPPYLEPYRAVAGAHGAATDHVLSGIGFLLAGGLWGLLYGAMVRRPSVASGMLFGILPTLFMWLVVAPIAGKPLFNGFQAKGLLLPLAFNVAIWGSFLGWYVERAVRLDRRGAAARAAIVR